MDFENANFLNLFEFKHKIGEIVTFVASENITGIVTGFLYRGHKQYEVTWFHEGVSNSSWFIESEIENTRER